MKVLFPAMFIVLLAMLSPNPVAARDNHDSYKHPTCNADPEEQLKPFLAEFGLTELPEPFVPPNITFVLAVQTGKLLYFSGTGPALPTGGFITGKVPTPLTVDDAKRAARLTAINLLAIIKKETGSLKQVKRIVKLFGMVNAEPDFTSHSAVINGASDLLVAVFGDCGYHARSAVGSRIIITHSFVKNTQKTPKVEINRAKKLRQLYTERLKHD